MFLPRGLGLVGVLLALEGCYRFVPVATPEPLPGSYVAAALTDAGSSELAQYLGLNIASVGGRLVRGSPEDLQISVFTVAARDGQETFWKGETAGAGSSPLSGWWPAWACCGPSACSRQVATRAAVGAS